MDTPTKLFISYSWTSPEHEQWVLDLATRLVESGVDALLDKWDLREGHDAISFMERMVNDPSINKVAIISDEAYARKANQRHGGVGTETQIISAEVYQQQGQDKFVAVLPSRGADGKPTLPTYYQSRIYIDLSGERYADEYEKLLRWIFNKPLHVRPQLGRRPDFLNESQSTSLGTTAAQQHALDAVRQGKAIAVGALGDYLALFTENLERFRMTGQSPLELDEAVVESVTQFTPYRDEFIRVITTLAQYLPSREVGQRLHRFFERLIPYMHPPENANTWQSADFDNFRFIVHELFLYTVAVLMREEQFELAAQLLDTPYYVEHRNGVPSAESYAVLSRDMPSFEARNRRLGRLSARADLLKGRTEGSSLDFKALMQADFLLYLRAAVRSGGEPLWWPETLVFATHAYGPFEVFARAKSRSYFDRLKTALGVGTRADLESFMGKVAKNEVRVPRWQFERFDPAVLTGWQELATR